MSLDKAIQSGKEHRKPYRGSKAFDPGCRNHGGCLWCQNGRLYKKHHQAPVDSNGREIICKIHCQSQLNNDFIACDH